MSGWVYQQSGSTSSAHWKMGIYAVNGAADGSIAYVSGSPSSAIGSWIYETASYTIPSWAQCPCYASLYTQLDTAASQTDTARFDDGTLSAGTSTGSVANYYVEDLLGTSRIVTQSNGVVCYDGDFYPFGGERPYTNTCAQNYKFEGKERDTETGNDNFGARYYSNRFGRWLSADWSAVPIAVPYANLLSPQTLNLYAMVVDDPESFTELDGHESGAVCLDTGRSCSPPKSSDDGGKAITEKNNLSDALELVNDARNNPDFLWKQMPRCICDDYKVDKFNHGGPHIDRTDRNGNQVGRYNENGDPIEFKGHKPPRIPRRDKEKFEKAANELRKYRERQSKANAPQNNPAPQNAPAKSNPVDMFCAGGPCGGIFFPTPFPGGILGAVPEFAFPGQLIPSFPIAELKEPDKWQTIDQT